MDSRKKVPRHGNGWQREYSVNPCSLADLGLNHVRWRSGNVVRHLPPPPPLRPALPCPPRHPRVLSVVVSTVAFLGKSRTISDCCCSFKA